MHFALAKHRRSVTKGARLVARFHQQAARIGHHETDRAEIIKDHHELRVIFHLRTYNTKYAVLNPHCVFRNFQIYATVML
jgi:hypothetical protein